MNFFIKHLRYYTFGKQIKSHPTYRDGLAKNEKELAKRPTRTDVINFLLKKLNRETTYLEIGVRNPEDNFNHIDASIKYSVDPGIEFKTNPVDFKLTSDVFFEQLKSDKILSPEVKFDVIFIDGLHTSVQVDRDIQNSFNYLKEDGFLVLHDCNPITEWHEREDYSYVFTPAGWCWSGTVWKAFVKWRSKSEIKSCCINTDWGVGILSKTHNLGDSTPNTNEFFEYQKLEQDREKALNLIAFSDLQKRLA